MERRGYIKQICAWWEESGTEADNYRINPAMFSKPGQNPCKSSDKNDSNLLDTNENCHIIKEAIEKLSQFLITSHSNKCSDPSCRFDPKDFKFRVRVKKLKTRNNSIEFKMTKKRGRKSYFERQQSDMLRHAKGTIYG